MRLGEYLWQKRYQGFTICGIYAHRFGYLDKYMHLLGEESEQQPNPLLTPEKPPLWKKAMDIPTKGP
ncbi:hypothetical protein AC1031_021211 [Aphanomyces cochlioides]|nr:hypothetical protein AC1031_021211 [Aphanomyces cochlioides]